MNHKDFKDIVIEALEELPDFFKEKIENLSVVVEDEPAPDQIEESGIDEKDILLGLYEGVPLLERNQFYGNVLPDKITLFKKNIERVCDTQEQMKKEIIHTVQHEIAHHFGISDAELKKWGKY